MTPERHKELVNAIVAALEDSDENPDVGMGTCAAWELRKIAPDVARHPDHSLAIEDAATKLYKARRHRFMSPPAGLEER